MTTPSPLANGRDAITTLKSRAHSLKLTGLPKARSAAQSAGKAMSGYALSTSRIVAKSLRGRKGSKPSSIARGAALLQAAPFLRTAGRFALRNPALLAAAGAAIAVIGYSAWLRREADATAASGE